MTLPLVTKVWLRYNKVGNRVLSKWINYLQLLRQSIALCNVVRKSPALDFTLRGIYEVSTRKRGL